MSEVNVRKWHEFI